MFFRRNDSGWGNNGWQLRAALFCLCASLASAQVNNGNAGGFEIDNNGTLFCQTGDGVLVVPGDDWADVLAVCTGVLDSAGMKTLGKNAVWSRDENWGNRGDGFDPDQFAGMSNKNDDLIGLTDPDPWDWNGIGGGPQKNDITNVMLYTYKDGSDNRWLAVAAETRSVNGDSHVDFEFNSAGLTVTTNPDGVSGQIIGNGTEGGRSVGLDFIVSIDFVQGGADPMATVRRWMETSPGVYEFMEITPPAGAVFTATNVLNELHDPGWGHYEGNGTPTTTMSALQMVETAINLDALGITDLDECNADSTITVKTRSSQSFTAELKDHEIVPFPLEPTPECEISGDDLVCPAAEVLLEVEELTGEIVDPQFFWTVSGDASFCGTDDSVVTGTQVCVLADDVCSGSFTVTVSVVGVCENVCEKTVTILDDTAPTLPACPNDIVVECGSTIPEATPPTPLEDCPAGSTVAVAEEFVPDCGVSGTLVRTYTASDPCGNETSCQQLITVVDTTPPVLVCPPDVILECPADTDPENTGIPEVFDQCTTISLTYLDVFLNGRRQVEDVCDETIQREWTAVDECGNTTSCIQLIRVVDTTPPEITCPDDITIDCTQDPDTSLTGEATATDTCNDVSIEFSDEFDPACGITGTLVRTWTAIDTCGNTATCNQIITIVDTTPPVITCPADALLECPADTSPSNTGTATAADDCGSATVTFSDSSTPGCGNTETIERTWTATDECGNQSSCVQIITVVDTTPPSITCPADAVLECPADTSPSNTGSATGSDTCGDVTITFSDNSTPGCGNTETIERTWTATDECGNQSSCVQIITVVDTTPPTIVCPPDVELECPADTSPANTGSAAASDTCGDASVSFSDEETTACGNTYTIARTWTAEDECGNTASCVQIIAVVDTTPPTITCPDDAVIDCNTPTIFVVTASDICDSSDPVTSCTVSGDPADYTAVDLGGGQIQITIHDTATITVTCVAVDECGNVSDPCEFTVSADCGNEACSPGYWRQSQHFNEWCEAGYNPVDDFCEPGAATLFKDAFNITVATSPEIPGSFNLNTTTLLQAVNLSGGSFNQALFLGSAALLNEAHPDVNQGTSVAYLQGVMQDAFDGTITFAQAHGIFAALIAQEDDGGCPLN